MVHQVPEVDADDLYACIERGGPFVILDTRTPEEYRRSYIPGGRSLPGGELAYRITNILAAATDDATCCGQLRRPHAQHRRRASLERMSLGWDVVGLRNGTAGWMLAGHELEFNADRYSLLSVTPEGQSAAEWYARSCAEEDGVRLIGVAQRETLAFGPHPHLNAATRTGSTTCAEKLLWASSTPPSRINNAVDATRPSVLLCAADGSTRSVVGEDAA